MHLTLCSLCGVRFVPSRKGRIFCSLGCFHKNNTKQFRSRTIREAMPYAVVWDQESMGSQSRIAKIWRSARRRPYVSMPFSEEWSTFGKFLAWSLSHGYESHLTLDRIDGSLGYSPSNCRWVTHQENSQNSKSNKFTPSKVLEARRLRASGATFKQIAEAFGVSLAQAHVVCKIKGWNNV